MQIDEIKVLYDYNAWANEKLLHTVEEVSEAQLHTHMPNGMGSMHTTLVHMLSGQWIWRTRWQGGTPDAMLRPESFPTLAALRIRWSEEELLMRSFLATLHDEDLTREIKYISTMVPGKIFTLPLWQTMVHLINHNTQHRSEIAMRLTEWEHSPGELGMNAFFNR
jgi:uncharacterized damage-inducible protein DinB